MHPDNESRKAAEELKTMGISYLERGYAAKAAEVLGLARQIESRINMAQWRADHEYSDQEANG